MASEPDFCRPHGRAPSHLSTLDVDQSSPLWWPPPPSTVASWSNRMSIFIERLDKLLDGTGSLNPSGDMSPGSDEEGRMGEEGGRGVSEEGWDEGPGGGAPQEGSAVGGVAPAPHPPPADSACEVCHEHVDRLNLSGAVHHSDDDSSVDSSTVPPQFGIVEPLLFRAGFPREQDIDFYRDLCLKSTVNLLGDPYPPVFQRFVEEEGITEHRFSVKGNKVTAEDMDRKVVEKILVLLSDRSNYPLLIHCRSGKHRTGCIVGCLRRLQGHSMHRIQDEYVQFAEHKQRKLDRQHIEAFDCTDVIPMLAPPLLWPPWFYVCEARARCRVRHSSEGTGEMLVSGVPGPAVGSGPLPVIVSPVLVGRGLSSDSLGSVGDEGPTSLGATALGPGVVIPGSAALGAGTGSGGAAGRDAADSAVIGLGSSYGGDGGGRLGEGGDSRTGAVPRSPGSFSTVCTGACGADGSGESSGVGLAGLSSATVAASAACTAGGGCGGGRSGGDGGGGCGTVVGTPFSGDTLGVDVSAAGAVCSLGGGSHALIASPLALPGSLLMREGLGRGVSGDGSSECSEGEGEARGTRGAPPDLSLR